MNKSRDKINNNKQIKEKGYIYDNILLLIVYSCTTSYYLAAQKLQENTKSVTSDLMRL